MKFTARQKHSQERAFAYYDSNGRVIDSRYDGIQARLEENYAIYRYGTFIPDMLHKGGEEIEAVYKYNELLFPVIPACLPAVQGPESF